MRWIVISLLLISCSVKPQNAELRQVLFFACLDKAKTIGSIKMPEIIDECNDVAEEMSLLCVGGCPIDDDK